MVFLDKPLFTVGNKDSGLESDAVRREPQVDLGIPLADVHSVQLDGDPDAARYLLTIIDKNFDEQTWEIDANSSPPTKKQRGAKAARLQIGGYPAGLSRRQPIDVTVESTRYRAALCQFRKPGQYVELVINLYANFWDATPGLTRPLPLPEMHKNYINLACIYGEPNAVKDYLLIIGYTKNGETVRAAVAWNLDSAGIVKALDEVPHTLTSEVYERRAKVGGGSTVTPLTTCNQICQLFILYSPGNPDMVELRNCDGTWTQTPIDTERNEVLEITHFSYDEGDCRSEYVEYRAYPPTDVSEVDCTQTKNGSTWNSPKCTSPEGYTLLGRSRFFVQGFSGPYLAEFMSLLDEAKGEIISTSRFWDGQSISGSAPYACPGRSRFTTLQSVLVSPAQINWKGNHAAAHARGRESYARTMGFTSNSGVENLWLLIQ